ncbi:MAG: hypothetical protein ACK5LG_21820 [Bacteroides thetaiotaomicron]
MYGKAIHEMINEFWKELADKGIVVIGTDDGKIQGKSFDQIIIDEVGDKDKVINLDYGQIENMVVAILGGIPSNLHAPRQKDCLLRHIREQELAEYRQKRRLEELRYQPTKAAIKSRNIRNRQKKYKR